MKKFLIFILLALFSAPVFVFILSPVEGFAQTAGAGTWTQVTPSVSPSPRLAMGLAYDSQNNKVVMFGGQYASGILNETWVYDVALNTWSNMSPSNPPSIREQPGMAYDSQSNLVVLFGGRTTNFVELNDLWVYNVNTNIWTQRFPSNPPPARSTHGFTYDSTRGLMIMHGGSPNNFYNDTWTYNTQTNVWTNMNPPAPLPGGSDHLFMVYDSLNQKTLSPGAHRYSNETGIYSNDLWAYDYPTNRWTERINATMDPSVPSPRDHHNGAYLGNGISLLFGGRPAGGAVSPPATDANTYVYNYSTNSWSQYSISGPVARIDHKMVNIGGARALLFGGHRSWDSSDVAYNDLWIYQGAGAPLWQDRNPATNAGSKDGHAMAYDSESQRVIIYGDHGVNLTNETWAYNYTTNSWTNMNPSTNPGLLATHKPIPYDSLHDRILLHGETGTWEYNYNLNLWTNRNPSTLPPGRDLFSVSMAYDSESDRTILFSRPTSGPFQVWSYNYSANAWTNMNTPSGPPADWRGITNAVYLLRYDRTVFIDNFDNRMWAYDYNANSWSQRAIAPTRDQSGGPMYTLSYDSESDKILWYGDDRISWVYDWTTNSWTNINAAPNPEYHHANIVYIPAVDRILMYGGCRWPSPCAGENKTWEFNYNNLGTPSPPSDTTAPSVPAGLTATAVSSSQINLSWTASTDNVGVTGYRVYRGGTQIATVTSGTAYQNTGLSPSTTYSYTVAAYDAAGNMSAQSGSVSATAQALSSSGTLPELPRVYLDTTYAPPSGNVITVNAGGNLQTALNNAQPGDIIVLQAGTTFTGNFNLPNKSGTGWIYIRSSAYSQLPSPGNRVNPSHASLMPKIVSPNSAPAITTSAGAHHYRFVGIEITTTSAIQYDLIFLEAVGGQFSLSQVPTDIVFDRSYIHGNPSGDISRGITFNSARTAAIDSYISEIHAVGFDTQAIGGWGGPGPFKIVNNYLEGAGENVIFGGADPTIQNLVPSDIEIKWNHFNKPLSWRVGDPSYAGIHWSVKNLFELKNAQRVLVEGNVFEHSWSDAQIGWAVITKSSNSNNLAPWSVTQDVTFQNNIFRHVAHGIDIAQDNGIYSSLPSRRIAVINNLFYDIGNGWSSSQPGLLWTIFGVDNVTIDHNTAFQDHNLLVLDTGPSYGSAVTNNIAPHNAYGVYGTGYGTGNPAINYYLPGAPFTRNVIWGAPQYASIYPAGNYFPSGVSSVGFVNHTGGDYHLSASSPYKNVATDGQDIGADIDVITAATACAISGACSGSTPPPSDTTVPSIPIGLSASAISTSQINLSWNASTDNVGVTGYRVYRGGIQIATVTTGTSYQNTGLSPSTSYSYTVAAYDAAGNMSAQSGSVSATTQTTGTTITLNSAVTYQTITGWDGVAQIGQDDDQYQIQNHTRWKNTVADLAVNDLGINRLRLGLGTSENPTDYFTQYINGQITRPQMNSGWSTVVNDNNDPFVINSSGFQFSRLDHAIDAVVLPFRQQLQARGESLFLYTHGLYDPASLYYRTSPEEYAEFILATYLHMQTRYGFVPDAVEVVNEPDGDGATSAIQMANMIVAAGNRLQANGFTPRFIVPSTVCLSNAISYFDQLIQVSGVRQYLLELSYHRYCGNSTADLQAVAGRAAQYGIQTSMLEHIASPYQDLHQDLKTANNTAWEQYTVAYPGTPNGGSYYSVDITDPVNPQVVMGPMTRFLRQYFKFIRRGATRISAATANAAFDPVAFINTNGTYVVVVNAAGGSSFSVGNLPVGTYGIKYTTASAYDVNLADITISLGQSLSTSIPAAGVITIYGRTGTTLPTDTTAPSVPASLVASVISSSQINLSWNASTDDVGVTGYRVYRGGTQIATVISGTSYQNTGLLPSTAYSYTVASYDAAGNVSGQSTSASATTQAAPSGAGTWTQLFPSTSAGSKDGPAFVYDIESQRVIMFGNHSVASTDENWVFDVNTNNWISLPSVTRPSPRAHPAAIYDELSDRMIIFGGQLASNANSNETWIYNYNANIWTNPNPANPPAAIFGNAAAYDSGSDRMIMYNGDITWAYDDTTNTWENRNLTMSASCLASRPGSMWFTAMAYDSINDRVIMVGQPTPSPTWAYDYNSNCWQNRNAANQPTFGQIPYMAYDSQSQLIVVKDDSFGGTDGTYTYNYLTNSWTNQNLSLFPTTHHVGMTYVPSQDRMILHGGGPLRDQTWEYRLGTAPPSDIQTPTVPTGLSATAVSSSQINLSWTASTDNVGVIGYRVYRGGAQIATVITGTGTSYQNTGLTAATAYSYTVAAYDAAGNFSAQSASASATTQAPLPSFNFSLSNGGARILPAAGTVTQTITSTLSSGTSQAVSFSLSSGLPSGVTGSFSPTSCNPNCTSTLTLRAASSTPLATTNIIVTGTGGGVIRTTSFSLTVSQPPTSSLFTINDRVQTTSNLNVRATPSTSGTFLGTQILGSQGTVIGGPVWANSYWWWNVNYDLGVDGWSVENYLTETAASCVLCSAPPQGCSYTGGTCQSCGTLSCPTPSVNNPPTVSAIGVNVADVNYSTPGLQVYEGTTVTYYSSAYDQDNNPLSWTWYYSIDGSARINYRSGTGQVQNVSFAYLSGTANRTYQWIISVSDGFVIIERTLDVLILPRISVTPPPAGQKFSTGSRVQTSASVAVRSSAGGTYITAKPAGQLGTVISGPVSAWGYKWWQIDYDTDPDGWSFQDRIELYPDVVSPAISISYPAYGATVKGTTTIYAYATDNIKVAGVQFQIDGQNFGVEDTIYPYIVSWKTNTVTDGQHAVTAIARDTAGNVSTSLPRTIIVDNTVPAISSVSAVSVTDSGATITWTTNDISTSQVQYGKTVSYGVYSSFDYAYLTSHSRKLSYLVPNTLYHFRAISKDKTGNVSYSPDFTFTTGPDTTPPKISLTSPYSGAYLKGTSTLYVYATDNVKVSGVQFRVDGQNIGIEDVTYPFSLAWTTTGAGDGQHYIEAVARDAAGNASTSQPRLVIVDNTAPVISSIAVSGITSTGATIIWNTNELTSHQVQYGKTPTYGSYRSGYTRTIPHTHTLTYLLPNTLYHFRVRAQDVVGNVSFSQDMTFTTAP